MTTLLSLFLSLISWLILAPTQLGGSVTYVIVDGNSMEAKFHRGDLILLRKAPTYKVGDAVTYQNAEMGRYVFHRIIDLNLDRFVLQGDNNAWLDSYQPTQEEIVGKLWMHLPRVGKAVEWLRLPINMALTVGLLGGSLMSSMMIRPSKHEKGEKGKNKPSGNFGGPLTVVLYFLGFIVLTFLALGIFAFTRPLARTVGQIPYQQEGKFSYSATGTTGVYDTDQVRSGEPIFPKLTCFLNLGFAYSMSANQLQEISGTHQLYARVLDEQSGWHRTIPMIAATQFVDNSYMTMATLDLCQVEALVNLMEQETGFHQNAYTLEIVSHVDIMAKVASQQVQDSFDPTLVFRFDEVHFYLANNDAQANPLQLSKQSLTGNSDLEANILPLLGWRPTVQMARGIALIGLGLSLGGFLGIGWYMYTMAYQSQEALIRLSYGSLIMDVHERSIDPSSPVIDVGTIDDLARMAERQNTMILHMTINFLNYYLVQSSGTTYRYVTNPGKHRVVKVEAYRHEITDYMTSSESNANGAEPVREVLTDVTRYLKKNKIQVPSHLGK
jgi:signal peptidase I